MSKTVAPLLSFDARGQIAKTQVYSSWKGIQYVRRYVVPANPNTAEQQLTRNTFRWLNNVWKFMPATAIEAWGAYADSNRFTDRNGFIKINNGALREETTLTNMILSPSARSGIVGTGLVTTPGDDQMTIAMTEPTLPTGWSIVNMTGAVIQNQDPQSDADYLVTAAVDTATAWSVTITGLVSAAEYLCGAWFKYLKPDGTFAYGQALQEMETTT